MSEGVSRFQQMADMFKALGDPARLKVFEFLCSNSCCPVAVNSTGEIRPVVGATVGEVCCQITGEERITSTISQQIKQLRQVGLIHVERRGKNMICRVNPDSLELIQQYIAVRKSGSSDTTCCA